MMWVNIRGKVSELDRENILVNKWLGVYVNEQFSHDQ